MLSTVGIYGSRDSFPFPISGRSVSHRYCWTSAVKQHKSIPLGFIVTSLHPGPTDQPDGALGTETPLKRFNVVVPSDKHEGQAQYVHIMHTIVPYTCSYTHSSFVPAVLHCWKSEGQIKQVYAQR